MILAAAISTYHIRETNEYRLHFHDHLIHYFSDYHFYKYILRGNPFWARVTQCCQGREHALNRRQMYHFPPEEDEEQLVKKDTLDSNNQLREPALDIIDPVYTDDYRHPPPPPVIPQPPKITYTVIDGRPGHRGGAPVPCGPAGRIEKHYYGYVIHTLYRHVHVDGVHSK